MEMQMAWLVAGAVATLAMGLLAGWFAARSAGRAALEAAVARVQAELQAELAQVRERLRGAEEGRREDAAQLAQLQADYGRTRSDLDEARDEVAKYKERSEQLPGLQQKLQQLEGELQARAAELFRVGQEEAQKAQLVRSQAAQLEEARSQLQAEKAGRARSEAEVARLGTELAQLQVTLQKERAAAQEKLELLQQAEAKLSDQFKVLANQILEEKSQRFAEQNRTALGTLLEPLSQQLRDFKGKVEEVYVQEGKDRSALAEQVRQLLTLNQALSQEAQNLTQALKGNAQTQGAWGEWLLEQTLSSSGLVKDQHYFLQDSTTREDGSRARPDALIHLPGERKLVVDAKLSLLAYEQYANAPGDSERAAALRAHLDSMKKHIAGLSAREYQKLYPTLDFVLMFVPLEPAFTVAATHDKELFTYAWDRNVLLVSPSTLLFVLRTVAYLWRQEAQNQNAQAIAERGARLYDKFVDFVKDLELLGQRLNQAQASYGDAFRKLHEGNGNLVSQAQKLTALGVKATKKLSPAVLQLADPEREAAEELAVRAAGDTPRESAPPPPGAAPAQAG